MDANKFNNFVKSFVFSFILIFFWDVGAFKIQDVVNQYFGGSFFVIFLLIGLCITILLEFFYLIRHDYRREIFLAEKLRKSNQDFELQVKQNKDLMNKLQNFNNISKEEQFKDIKSKEIFSLGDYNAVADLKKTSLEIEEQINKSKVEFEENSESKNVEKVSPSEEDTGEFEESSSIKTCEVCSETEPIECSNCKEDIDMDSEFYCNSEKNQHYCESCSSKLLE